MPDQGRQTLALVKHLFGDPAYDWRTLLDEAAYLNLLEIRPSSADTEETCLNVSTPRPCAEVHIESEPRNQASKFTSNPTPSCSCRTMLLAHRIRLDATSAQCDYFRRAAGTARRVWNWALAEWQRQEARGVRPNAMGLKKQFNAIKYIHPDWLDSEGNPWLHAIHRDAHAQPFAHLACAMNRYFNALKAHLPAHPPGIQEEGTLPRQFLYCERQTPHRWQERRSAESRARHAF